MVAPDASPPRAAGAGGQARGASILETSDAMDQACELIMGRYREDGGEGGAAVRAKLLDLYRRASAEAGRVRAKEGEERLRRAAPPPSVCGQQNNTGHRDEILAVIYCHCALAQGRLFLSRDSAQRPFLLHLNRPSSSSFLLLLLHAVSRTARCY